MKSKPVVMVKLICPRCGDVLHTHQKERYYNTEYGCTIHCYSCKLHLIGVDLSVCMKCDPAKKEGNECGTKLTTLMEEVE